MQSIMEDENQSMLLVMLGLENLLRKEEEKKDESNLQPIHWICDNVVLQRMIDRGFRIMESMNCEERTELIQKAVKNKDLSLIRIMMENGLKFYESFESGENWWLLGKVVEVCEEGPEYEEIVKYLLDKGCPPDNIIEGAEVRDDLVKSHPLYHAVCKGLWDIASLLISAGADPNYSEIQREFGACLDPRFIDVMKKHNLDFHLKVTDSFLRGLFGNSDLPSRDVAHFCEKQIPMINHLLEEGMNGQNIVNYNIHAWYNIATKCNRVSPTKYEDYLGELLRLMLAQGMNVNDRNNMDKTALYRAAENHQDKIFKLLLENGADINAADRHGRTPLLALTYKPDGLDMERFRFFLQAGADVNVTWKKETETQRCPYILLYLLNNNMRYKDQLLYLLDNCYIEIPFGRVDALEYAVFQPSILYKLLQVGVSGYSIIISVLVHALMTNTEKGYYLVRHVYPNFQNIFPENETSQMIQETECIFKHRIEQDIRNAPSLVTWSIDAIRRQLLWTSRCFSILPRLRQLAQEVPLNLRSLLTLECFMVDDCNRCFLQQQEEEAIYDYNRRVLDFSEIPQQVEVKLIDMR